MVYAYAVVKDGERNDRDESACSNALNINMEKEGISGSSNYNANRNSNWTLVLSRCFNIVHCSPKVNIKSQRVWS